MHLQSVDLLRGRLDFLERGLQQIAKDLAVFLVYDRPSRVEERPGIERAFFSQRCVSDLQLEQTVTALRSVGAYVELFHGEQEFLKALSGGRLESVNRKYKLVYNGIEGGIAHDGFQPGRKALIPSVADSYSMLCSNSNAYACALGRHKYHYFTVLQSAGLTVPETWHFQLGRGWVGNKKPSLGKKVIVKSTFESWSVGVTEESIFVVDDTCESRVAGIANGIGQAVCVQEFIPGPEVCVPIFSIPERIVLPCVQAILAKAPDSEEAVMTINDNLVGGGVAYRRYDGAKGTMAHLACATVEAFNVLELEAFARIDFRVDNTGKPWIIDVGVSPGISMGSSAFASVAELGFNHEAFLRIVVAATLANKGVLS